MTMNEQQLAINIISPVECTKKPRRRVQTPVECAKKPRRGLISITPDKRRAVWGSVNHTRPSVSQRRDLKFVPFADIHIIFFLYFAWLFENIPYFCKKITAIIIMAIIIL